MELKKYISETKKIIDTAYTRIESALMTKDIKLEELKKKADMFSESGFKDEHKKIMEEFELDSGSAVEECRAAIAEQKAGYMKEVTEFYKADGGKIDLNDMNLLKSEINLTLKEVCEMVAKHKDNPTMIRVIQKHVRENTHMGRYLGEEIPTNILRAFAIVEKCGKREEKIFDRFVHLGAMGLNHPDTQYTVYQSRLDDYESDSYFSLLKAKLYIDEETQAAINEEENKRLKKSQEGYDPHNKDYNWYV